MTPTSTDKVIAVQIQQRPAATSSTPAQEATTMTTDISSADDHQPEAAPPVRWRLTLMALTGTVTVAEPVEAWVEPALPHTGQRAQRQRTTSAPPSSRHGAVLAKQASRGCAGATFSGGLDTVCDTEAPPL